MVKDTTKGTIEYIRTLQAQLLEDDDLLGAALPCHCDEVISRLEKYMEKQIANLKRQADEIKVFLDTDTERKLANKMILDLDNLLSVIKALKHQDMQFNGDPRNDPLGDFAHFYDTFSKSYYAVVNDYISIKNNIFALVNTKLNEQTEEEGK